MSCPQNITPARSIGGEHVSAFPGTAGIDWDEMAQSIPFKLYGDGLAPVRLDGPLMRDTAVIGDCHIPANNAQVCNGYRLVVTGTLTIGAIDGEPKP